MLQQQQSQSNHDDGTPLYGGVEPQSDDDTEMGGMGQLGLGEGAPLFVSQVSLVDVFLSPYFLLHRPFANGWHIGSFTLRSGSK